MECGLQICIIGDLINILFNEHLAAKSLKEAQRGIVFAAFLKLIIPLIVVIPGIVAFVMYSQPEGTAIIDGAREAFTKANGGVNYDKAYPWLISNFIPTGLKGVVVAALTAAIISSLASMLNSTATIFTMDIYKPYFAKNSSEKNLVNVGRITAGVALVIALIIAPFLKKFTTSFSIYTRVYGFSESRNFSCSNAWVYSGKKLQQEVQFGVQYYQYR